MDTICKDCGIVMDGEYDTCMCGSTNVEPKEEE